MGAFVLFFLFFLLALTTTTPASKSDGDVGGTIRDLLERTDKRYIKKDKLYVFSVSPELAPPAEKGCRQHEEDKQDKGLEKKQCTVPGILRFFLKKGVPYGLTATAKFM